MKRDYCKSVMVVIAAFVVLQLFAEYSNAQRNRGRSGGGWKFVAEKYDANNDGSVSLAEYTRGEDAFKTLDINGDGVLDQADWSSRSRSRGGNGEAPVAGQKAPNFSLSEIRDSSKTVTLSDFAGKKPVALLFGSCT